MIVSHARKIGASVIAALMIGACGGVPAPRTAAAPAFPDFVMPVLSPPDARQAALDADHQKGWQFLQAGDLNAAQKEFAAVLKRSPAFYPSDAAMGYVELARKNHPAALAHFDQVLGQRVGYVPALVGRGETLLALSRDGDALSAFEAALRVDPALPDIARRVEVLKARAAQENVASARAAAQAGRLDEAARAYGQAIASSPESAFLFRDLGDVEVKQGKQQQALEHYRRAIQLESTDAASRVRIGEILETQGDIEGAKAAYTEANTLEPSANLRRRLASLDERLAYLRLPAEYRTLGDRPSVTRAELAALIGIRLSTLLATVPAQGVLVTDVRDSWASSWITTVAGAGIMEPYDNHTFQPVETVRRSDLAGAVSRLLKVIAARRPELMKQWQGKQSKMTDVGVSNLNYADASLAVSAGILQLTDTGAFELARGVSGSESIEAINRLDRLYTTSK